MNRIPYLTDLTDEQWNHIKELIPPEKPGGRHRELNMRDVINAISFYKGAEPLDQIYEERCQSI